MNELTEALKSSGLSSAPRGVFCLVHFTVSPLEPGHVLTSPKAAEVTSWYVTSLPSTSNRVPDQGPLRKLDLSLPPPCTTMAPSNAPHTVGTTKHL